ncbi:Uma2 family endonuclease [Sinosporangium album]|uniref:Uma2 family endonuclease n=1 Tax=Sinosporangium album TaxID=504805 RepID=UPI000B81E1CC|nr:Uma2 family endonuclease [Sinosporangium album]
MPSDEVPDWLIPPNRGFFAEDLDHLPGLPAHTELLDGSLVLVSPQMDIHSLIVDMLVFGLRRTAPRGVRVRREMSVVLGPRQRPEPDLIALKPDTVADMTATAYQAENVSLVVEVVSPESAERDRNRKPLLYAQAGIRHFWLVEQESGHPQVTVFELDPATKAYVATGVHRDRLTVAVPFEIDIDLTEIDRL